MLTSTSSRTSTQFFQDFLGEFYSRRLLLRTPLFQSTNLAAPPGTPHDPSEPYSGNNSFDANVVMVLSVLLCALICSLGLNSIIRCALRCSTFVASRSGANSTARLANTGVKQKALKTFTILNFSPDLKLPGLGTECVICLSEFTLGDRVRLLPKCNHGFHVRCIDKWLSSHSSCPTCRHCLLETCQKIVGCNQASSSESEAQPAQETIVSIPPLEPEGLIQSYRGIS
ncbi:RING-H2 finger protein ATL78-like [Mangifera indica]|uniref:RING-H2 finger protein ATL78-like n=1 Tax=Mangifera indica TaxID=29780 RepID=UPI001CFAF9F7|nr:RING-H2 finger protein ATL78-like [Mangifera indica]